MDNQRIFLYGALFFVLFLIWDAWQKDHAPAPQEVATETRAPSFDAGLPELQEGPAASGDAPAREAAPPAAQATPPAAEAQKVRIVTDVLDLLVDTRGANIVSARLLEYPVDKGNPDLPVQLMNVANGEFFVTQSGLRSAGDLPAPDYTAVFRSSAESHELAAGEDELVVGFTWQADNGVEIEKRYTFHRGRYEIGLDFIVRNGSEAPWRGDAYLQLTKRLQGVERSFFKPSSYSYTGPAFFNGEKYRKLDTEDLREASLWETARGGWGAMLQHYFLGAVIAPQDQDNRFYAASVGRDTYRVGFVQPAITVAPGAEGVFENRLFIGPKLQDQLAEAAPKLELAVDYGMLTIIAEPLFWLLDKIHTLVGNWGWAIILLTVLIKLVFYKLSETSGKSMAKMRRMQPKMQALKERYGDDREKLNRAMMELYQKEKINPFAGCLPILIQMPVFIALYWVLLESVELRQAEWILWVNDLSSPDRFYILPVLMGLAMWAQQKLNPQPTDPIQARMLMIMPLLMVAFATIMPAGLVLYWVVNTVLSVAQQWQINRVIEKANR